MQIRVHEPSVPYLLSHRSRVTRSSLTGQLWATLPPSTLPAPFSPEVGTDAGLHFEICPWCGDQLSSGIELTKHYQRKHVSKNEPLSPRIYGPALQSLTDVPEYRRMLEAKAIKYAPRRVI
jgi:hypothetical protein